MKTPFLQKGISTAALSLGAVVAFAAEDRPNILYIMSDDHSFQTIGVYASVLKDYVKTPNIDRIAHEGVRMDNCFVTNSISTPSRAAILTGQYSHHNQVYTLADELPAGHPSMAKELQKNGYQTAIIGKWHIGTQPEGFDFYSVMPGQGKYENPGFMESGLPFDVKHAVRTQGYCTDVITDKCIDWMEKADKNKPFFLMCHFKAPHAFYPGGTSQRPVQRRRIPRTGQPVREPRQPSHTEIRTQQDFRRTLCRQDIAQGRQGERCLSGIYPHLPLLHCRNRRERRTPARMPRKERATGQHHHCLHFRPRLLHGRTRACRQTADVRRSTAYAPGHPLPPENTGKYHLSNFRAEH